MEQQLTLDPNQVNSLFKQSIQELIRDQRDLFVELFAEAIEDLALVKAIEEGEGSESVSREAIFQVFTG
jgi:hypothetical protein